MHRKRGRVHGWKHRYAAGSVRRASFHQSTWVGCCQLSPVTPPDPRVRIRRFGGLSYRLRQSILASQASRNKHWAAQTEVPGDSPASTESGRCPPNSWPSSPPSCPLVRRVTSRTFALNRITALGAIRRFGSRFAVKLKPGGTLVLVFLSLTYGGMTFQQSVFSAVAIDIAPRNAGAMMGKGNTAANAGAVISQVASITSFPGSETVMRRSSPWRSPWPPEPSSGWASIPPSKSSRTPCPSPS